MSSRKNARALTPDQKVIRCAVYTRKSTEEGLELAFNSLDAQRESAEAFVAAQRHEGWICLPDRYDDGGFSGGTIERPALRRLLADIEAGKVDCVVVYKVDRLSRSLMDFARIMQVFESQKVSFVSVTQQFNTTHSMGRLTLNILLSFAQFERGMRMAAVTARAEQTTALTLVTLAGAVEDIAGELVNGWAAFGRFCQSRIGVKAEVLLRSSEIPVVKEIQQTLEQYRHLRPDEARVSELLEMICRAWDGRFGEGSGDGW